MHNTFTFLNFFLIIISCHLQKRIKNIFYFQYLLLGFNQFLKPFNGGWLNNLNLSYLTLKKSGLDKIPKEINNQKGQLLWFLFLFSFLRVNFCTHLRQTKQNYTFIATCLYFNNNKCMVFKTLLCTICVSCCKKLF